MPEHEGFAEESFERTDPAAEPAFGQPRDLDEVRDLIRSAYGQARASGRNDWATMTSAVLKNRILGLTDQEFDEKKYGARTFLHLLILLPDLVEIEGTRAPHIVKLAQASDRQPQEESYRLASEMNSGDSAINWRRIRVRQDLWRAIMDYTTGARYVLDEETGTARPAQVEDCDLPSLPTIDPNVLGEWQRDFISSVTAVDSTPSLLGKLTDWQAAGGSSFKLPPALRGSWNQNLKQRVVDRLEAWFAETGSHAPGNLIVRVSPEQANAGLGDDLRLRELRELVIAHIRVMTYEELLALHFPVATIVRMSRHESH